MNFPLFKFTFALLVICTFVNFTKVEARRQTAKTKPKTQSHAKDDPICIVGAGLSGLNIALQLKNKGEQVHVFERDGKVGGKVKTFKLPQNLEVKGQGQSPDPGHVQIEMGAAFIIQNNRRLRNLTTRYNLTLTPFDRSIRASYDEASGVIQPTPDLDLSVEVMLALQKAVKNYAIYRSQHFGDVTSGKGFSHTTFGFVNVSAELFTPLSQWLDHRNLSILKPAFRSFVLSGYGRLEDLSALYALYTVDEGYLKSLLEPKNTFFSLKEGLGAIPREMQKELEQKRNIGTRTGTRTGTGTGTGVQVTISLNSHVTSITRGQNSQTLRVSGHRSPIKCSKTILAFPPLLSQLDSVITDLTRAEKEILSQVKIHKYISSGSYNPPLNLSIYEEAGEIKGNGEVVLLVKQGFGDLPSVYSSYSWIGGDFDSLPNPLDLDNMKKQRDTLFQKFQNGDSNSNGNPLTFFQDATDYFPHVTTESMQNGFYNRFSSLQGRRGLYFASTLLGFESMETALQMSEDFVQRYFR